jgi:hypothetical protein
MQVCPKDVPTLLRQGERAVTRASGAVATTSDDRGESPHVRQRPASDSRKRAPYLGFFEPCDSTLRNRAGRNPMAANTGSVPSGADLFGSNLFLGDGLVSAGGAFRPAMPDRLSKARKFLVYSKLPCLELLSFPRVQSACQ